MPKSAAPDDLLRAMDERMAAYGPQAVVDLIAADADPARRRQLFSAAQRHFGKRTDRTRSLDALIVVVRAGIDEGMRQCEAETSPAAAARLKDFANALSYNLAADLAECWEGDTAPRARRHFEAGLAAAKDCVRWRAELAKPPGPRSTAWWACGVHELSLGRAADAIASFEQSLEWAGKSVATNGDFGVILAKGCLGIARRSRAFDEACAAFQAAADRATGPAADDAKSGLSQLRWYAARLADANRPADVRF